METFEFTNQPDSVYGLSACSIPLPGTSANVLACSIQPSCQSHGHNHFEREIFFLVSGTISATNGKNTQTVHAGTAVVFDEFEPHILKNLSESETAEMLSVYWPYSAQNEQSENEEETTQDEPVLLFSTPPTPNGDLHLGHLSGPYLAGDILARKLRASGVSTLHASGRDDHQTYVQYMARKTNTNPKMVADANANKILSTLSKADIVLDGFITPDSDGEYAQFVLDGIDILIDRGLVFEQTEDAMFDAEGHYLHEAFIHGLCPYCQSDSDGNACEACGRPNQCVDLLNPTISGNNSTPVVKRVTRLYFRLSAFEEELKQYIRMATMPASVFHLCSTMLEEGLPDICISHPNEWGIQHRLKNHDKSVVYVWFEMAFGYLWQAAQMSELKCDVWTTVKSVYHASYKVGHAYGFDNAFYHTLLFPAIYLGLDMDLKPPQYHVVNELLELDGSKFSTSRGHLIWARDLLADLPSDYVRFALSYQRPEGCRSSFSLPLVLNLMNRVFVEDLEEWIQTLLATTSPDGIIPEPGAWLDEHKSFFRAINEQAKCLDHALNLSGFSSRRAARCLESIIDMGARFARSQRQLFKSNGQLTANYRRTAIFLLAYGLKKIAFLSAPIIPNIASDLHTLLALTEEHQTAMEFGQDHRLNLSQIVNLPPAHSNASIPKRTPVEQSNTVSEIT